MSYAIKEFNQVRTDLDHLAETRDTVITALGLEHQDALTPGHIHSAIVNLFRDESSSRPVGVALFDFLKLTDFTCKSLDKMLSSIEHEALLEIEAKNRAAAWEKRNAYNVWLHRTIRWIAGAALVVLLYSSFVWLQSRCDFIKIPMRDWVVNSQPNG